MKTKRHRDPFKLKSIAKVLLAAFTLMSVTPPGRLYAQVPLNVLPAPGRMIAPSGTFVPALVRGIKVYPDKPLEFSFIVDPGSSGLKGESLTGETAKMAKYFMASLTLPEEDIWVNLSPYEKDRMIEDKVGQTEMGRDMLAQDYLLKQLTASLIYPQDDLGKSFWDRVYKAVYAKHGTTDIPVNTFNKVWIVADRAAVYETSGAAYIIDSHLKVMLEEDYLALEKNSSLSAPISGQKVGGGKVGGDSRDISSLSSEIVRDIIVPAIEKEVNEGKHFATLRQIYSAQILATWYKQTLRESLLGQVYVDQGKVLGVNQPDIAANKKIYEQYLEAFQKGAFDLVREDYDESTREYVHRRYFSGGLSIDTGAILRRVSGDLGFISAPDRALVNRALEPFAPDKGFVQVDLAAVEQDQRVIDPGIPDDLSGRLTIQGQPLDQNFLSLLVRYLRINPTHRIEVLESKQNGTTIQMVRLFHNLSGDNIYGNFPLPVFIDTMASWETVDITATWNAVGPQGASQNFAMKLDKTKGEVTIGGRTVQFTPNQLTKVKSGLYGSTRRWYIVLNTEVYFNLFGDQSMKTSHYVDIPEQNISFTLNGVNVQSRPGEKFEFGFFCLSDFDLQPLMLDKDNMSSQPAIDDLAVKIAQLNTEKIMPVIPVNILNPGFIARLLAVNPELMVSVGFDEEVLPENIEISKEDVNKIIMLIKNGAKSLVLSPEYLAKWLDQDVLTKLDDQNPVPLVCAFKSISQSVIKQWLGSLHRKIRAINSPIMDYIVFRLPENLPREFFDELAVAFELIFTFKERSRLEPTNFSETEIVVYEEIPDELGDPKDVQKLAKFVIELNKLNIFPVFPTTAITAVNFIELKATDPSVQILITHDGPVDPLDLESYPSSGAVGLYFQGLVAINFLKMPGAAHVLSNIIKPVIFEIKSEEGREVESWLTQINTLLGQSANRTTPVVVRVKTVSQENYMNYIVQKIIDNNLPQVEYWVNQAQVVPSQDGGMIIANQGQGVPFTEIPRHVMHSDPATGAMYFARKGNPHEISGFISDMVLRGSPAVESKLKQKIARVLKDHLLGQSLATVKKNVLDSWSDEEFSKIELINMLYQAGMYYEIYSIFEKPIFVLKPTAEPVLRAFFFGHIGLDEFEKQIDEHLENKEKKAELIDFLKTQRTDILHERSMSGLSDSSQELEMLTLPADVIDRIARHPIDEFSANGEWVNISLAELSRVQNPRVFLSNGSYYTKLTNFSALFGDFLFAHTRLFQNQRDPRSIVIVPDAREAGESFRWKLSEQFHNGDMESWPVLSTSNVDFQKTRSPFFLAGPELLPVSRAEALALSNAGYKFYGGEEQKSYIIGHPDGLYPGAIRWAHALNPLEVPLFEAIHFLRQISEYVTLPNLKLTGIEKSAIQYFIKFLRPKISRSLFSTNPVPQLIQRIEAVVPKPIGLFDTLDTSTLLPLFTQVKNYFETTKFPDNFKNNTGMARAFYRLVTVLRDNADRLVKTGEFAKDNFNVLDGWFQELDGLLYDFAEINQIDRANLVTDADPVKSLTQSRQWTVSRQEQNAHVAYLQWLTESNPGNLDTTLKSVYFYFLANVLYPLADDAEKSALVELAKKLGFPSFNGQLQAIPTGIEGIYKDYLESFLEMITVDYASKQALTTLKSIHLYLSDFRNKVWGQTPEADNNGKQKLVERLDGVLKILESSLSQTTQTSPTTGVFNAAYDQIPRYEIEDGPMAFDAWKQKVLDFINDQNKKNGTTSFVISYPDLQGNATGFSYLTHALPAAYRLALDVSRFTGTDDLLKAEIGAYLGAMGATAEVFVTPDIFARLDADLKSNPHVIVNVRVDTLRDIYDAAVNLRNLGAQSVNFIVKSKLEMMPGLFQTNFRDMRVMANGKDLADLNKNLPDEMMNSAVRPTPRQRQGGIDLKNIAGKLIIRRDENSRPFPVEMQDLPYIRQNLQGMTPFVIRFFTIPSALPFLGLNDTDRGRELSISRLN